MIQLAIKRSGFQKRRTPKKIKSHSETADIKQEIQDTVRAVVESSQDAASTERVAGIAVVSLNRQLGSVPAFLDIMEIHPSQRGCLENSCPGIFAHPGFPRRWDIEARSEDHTSE